LRASPHAETTGPSTAWALVSRATFRAARRSHLVGPLRSASDGRRLRRRCCGSLRCSGLAAGPFGGSAPGPSGRAHPLCRFRPLGTCVNVRGSEKSVKTRKTDFFPPCEIPSRPLFPLAFGWHSGGKADRSKAQEISGSVTCAHFPAHRPPALQRLGP
jgi:hypothetical protein